MNEAFKINSWTAGGLHSETDPAGGKGTSCAMLVQVQKAKFARLDPKIDDAKAKDGFYCGKNVTVTGDFGKGNIDPTRTH